MTLGLSIAAITITQLLLLAQARDTAAVQAKLDGLIHASDADDELIGMERRP